MKKLLIIIAILLLTTPTWASDLSFILTIKGQKIELTLEEIRDLKKTLECITPKLVEMEPLTFEIDTDRQWVITPNTTTLELNK